MINIKLICVGDYKEKYLKDMNDEYLKRLSRYCKFESYVLKDEKLPDNLNDSNVSLVKDKEASLILAKLKTLTNSYIFVLDENGKEYTSMNFANKMQLLPTIGYSTVVFIIGGSLGLSEEIKKAGHELISFSKMTFPHQLIRIFLLEQLFRSFKINNNETYHH